VARALMDVEEANRMTVEAFKRDQDWIRRHLLASVFDNVAWTFVDRSAGGGYKGLVAASPSIRWPTAIP
jgi:hypothetical protein